MASNQSALFYPNLCGVIQVRLSEEGSSNPIYATNDYFAASSEVRHFIDAQFLRELNPQLVHSIVTPTPPCTSLWGTFRNQRDETPARVLGMLRSPLHISVHMGRNHSWVQAKLNNVLVVEDLPVPLHVSLKSLGLFPQFQDMPKFSRSKFPRNYHQHGYWTRDQNDVAVVGGIIPETSIPTI